LPIDGTARFFRRDASLNGKDLTTGCHSIILWSVACRRFFLTSRYIIRAALYDLHMRLECLIHSQPWNCTTVDANEEIIHFHYIAEGRRYTKPHLLVTFIRASLDGRLFKHSADLVQVTLFQLSSLPSYKKAKEHASLIQGPVALSKMAFILQPVCSPARRHR
jgi:hypothetical protein